MKKIAYLLFLSLFFVACSGSTEKVEEAEKISIDKLFERWKKEKPELEGKKVIITGIVTNMQSPTSGQTGFSLVKNEKDSFTKSGVYCAFMSEAGKEVKSGQKVTVTGTLEDFFDKPSLKNCEFVK